MLNDPSDLNLTIDLFLGFGWFGVALCFLFNFGHIALLIYDSIRGCKLSNRELMDKARKEYYKNMLATFEEVNKEVPLHTINRWIRLGNLNDRHYTVLPDLPVRVECYRMFKGSGKL